MIDLGKSPPLAVAALRIHQQWSPDELLVEKQLPDDLKRTWPNAGMKSPKYRQRRFRRSLPAARTGKVSPAPPPPAQAARLEAGALFAHLMKCAILVLADMSVVVSGQ